MHNMITWCFVWSWRHVHQIFLLCFKELFPSSNITKVLLTCNIQQQPQTRQEKHVHFLGYCRPVSLLVCHWIPLQWLTSGCQMNCKKSKWLLGSCDMKSGKISVTSYRHQVVVVTSEFRQSAKSFTTACDSLVQLYLSWYNDFTRLQSWT